MDERHAQLWSDAVNSRQDRKLGPTELVHKGLKGCLSTAIKQRQYNVVFSAWWKREATCNISGMNELKSKAMHEWNRTVSRSLTSIATTTHVHSFVTSRLDYCSSLYIDLPATRLNCLSRASFMSNLLAPPPCTAGPSLWLALWYGMEWSPIGSSHFLEYSHRNSFSNSKQHYLAAGAGSASE